MYVLNQESKDIEDIIKDLILTNKIDELALLTYDEPNYEWEDKIIRVVKRNKSYLNIIEKNLLDIHKFPKNLTQYALIDLGLLLIDSLGYDWIKNIANKDLFTYAKKSLFSYLVIKDLSFAESLDKDYVEANFKDFLEMYKDKITQLKEDKINLDNNNVKPKEEYFNILVKENEKRISILADLIIKGLT